MITVRRMIQTSSLFSRTKFIFTMFNGPRCLQLKINFSNLYIGFGTWEVQRLKLDLHKGEAQKKYSRKGRLNKKNSRTPINP